MPEDRDPGTLLVADSFRVRTNPSTGDAEVRGLPEHTDRFARAAREASGRTLVGVGSFLDDSRVQIAEYGEGNPRWECWKTASGSFDLRLALRPLPELRTTIELVVVGAVDLEHPERKGMNIPRFAELNRKVDAEAVITAPDGSIREGATTALIWWKDGKGYVSASTARVPSVTERLVRIIAEVLGAPLEAARVTNEELSECEVWAVNALHGIRPATSIDGVALPGPEERRLALFSDALDHSWQPVVPSAQG